MNNTIEHQENNGRFPAEEDWRLYEGVRTRRVMAFFIDYVIILLLMIPAMLAVLSVVREKEVGSIINFYVTPVTRVEFLLGKQLPYIALAMLNFALMMGMAVTFFGVPFSGSLAGFILSSLVYVVATTGLGLLVSVFITSQVAPRASVWVTTTAQAQLKRLGFALDWSRELATCEPDYYGHEQALFIDLYEAGLVYRKESEVNWDPVDMTVLANEQVIDGRGWRSGALVEKRKLSQWFLKITAFADELLEAIEGLERWPDKVRTMQSNWIGRSRGAEVRFPLTDTRFGETIDVFTTRPDTLFGASFLALAPDHPMVKALAKDNPEIEAFCQDCARMGTTEEEIEKAPKKEQPAAEPGAGQPARNGANGFDSVRSPGPGPHHRPAAAGSPGPAAVARG